MRGVHESEEVIVTCWNILKENIEGVLLWGYVHCYKKQAIRVQPGQLDIETIHAIQKPFLPLYKIRLIIHPLRITAWFIHEEVSCTMSKYWLG